MLGPIISENEPLFFAPRDRSWKKSEALKSLISLAVISTGHVERAGTPDSISSIGSSASNKGRLPTQQPQQPPQHKPSESPVHQPYPQPGSQPNVPPQPGTPVHASQPGNPALVSQPGTPAHAGQSSYLRTSMQHWLKIYWAHCKIIWTFYVSGYANLKYNIWC